LTKSSRGEDDGNYYASQEENQRVADSAHQVDSRYVQHEENRLDVAQHSESAEKNRLNRQSQREWMENNSNNYAELADFTVGSASSRPEEEPQLLYANLQEASQEGPIYAQVDKSKKTNKK
jgi:hypothetical protein